MTVRLLFSINIKTETTGILIKPTKRSASHNFLKQKRWFENREQCSVEVIRTFPTIVIFGPAKALSHPYCSDTNITFTLDTILIPIEIKSTLVRRN